MYTRLPLELRPFSRIPHAAVRLTPLIQTEHVKSIPIQRFNRRGGRRFGELAQIVPESDSQQGYEMHVVILPR
jgi:hypothetical protein